MKKKLFTIMGCIAMIPFAIGQEKKQENGFGIKGGINLSDVHHQKNTPLPFEKDSEMKLSFHVGVFAEVFVSETRKIAIQPELVYSQDGFKINDFNYSNRSGELDYTLHTFNLPILVKYYFTKNFNVFAGPQVVYQESQKYELDGNEINISDLGHQRRLNSTNLTVVSGLEFSSVCGFSINARYLHGTHTFYKSMDNVDITHRGFQIGLGYKF